ncbi:MAG: hypothetical protein O2931_09595 [Planctomycetota bacterium]|nr:hypothetical protein [Planctomycetota bacterium]MDA1179034.1 hypothetical protein [Planctomycetota bacterium]
MHIYPRRRDTQAFIFLAVVLFAVVPGPLRAESNPGEQVIPVADSPASATDNPAVATPEVPAPPLPSQKLRFNFHNAPWEKVLQWLADESDLSFSADVIPRGTFTYVDQNRELSPDRAIDLVNGYLLIKGYTLVRHDRMLIVIDLEEDLDRRLVSELVTEIPLEELEQRGRYEVSKTRFILKHADAKVAEQQISPLLSPVGSLVVMPEAKQIVATDTGDKLRAIREVLAALERETTSKSSQLHTFRLRVANAEEVLVIARPLLQIGEGTNAAEDGSIRISADPLGRTVYATGTPEKIALVQQIVEQVDGDANSGVTNRTVDPPQFLLHKTTSADASSILRVLQTLFVGDPAIRMEVDTTSGGILAYARLSQHQSIQATIAEMEQSPPRMEVIPLRVTDPKVAVGLVEKLFKSSESPPIVDGTLDPRQLILRGTPAQVLQVRRLLASMGEQTAESRPGDRGNLRVVPMDSGMTEELLQRLQQIWPQVSSQPLRIVPNVDRSTPPSRRRPAKDDDASRGDREASENAMIAVHRSGSDTSDDRTSLRQRNEPFSHYRPVRFDTDESHEVDRPTSDNSASGIVVSVTPGGLLLASQDAEALDMMESLLDSLRQSGASGPRFHLFYLKHVQAESALELLGGILSGGGSGALVSNATVSSTTQNTARPGNTGNTVVSAGVAGAPHMVADKRLNALFVQGSASQIDTVERLLDAIDSESGPDEVLTFPKPHFIPVYYTRAADVAAVLKQLYVHRLEQGDPNAQSIQRGMMGLAFRGMFGRGGGEQSNANNSNPTTATAGQLPKMTVAVDEGSNSVVVAAVGPLLKEVESVVREIDVRAESKPPEAVTVVTLKRTHPMAVQQALAGLLGDQIQVSGTSQLTNSNYNANPSNRSSMGSRNRGQFSQGGADPLVPGGFPAFGSRREGNFNRQGDSGMGRGGGQGSGRGGGGMNGSGRGNGRGR